jgi:hypothetical protein
LHQVVPEHNFVKKNGYVNVPLEGLWLRGPYLHNGSVPTLADLLEEPAQHRSRVTPTASKADLFGLYP